MVSPSRLTGPVLPGGPFSDRVGRLWACFRERKAISTLFDQLKHLALYRRRGKEQRKFDESRQSNS